MKSNRLHYLILLGILAALSVYFYRHTIWYFPSFVHAWTQSDRYALALAFIDSGMNPLLPRTFNLMTIDGITAVDFPWHEYLIACIMKISGNQSPWIFRLYTLVYALLGYVFLFKLSRLFTTSLVKGLVLVLFMFTLPVLVYYQAGFVPSTPALSTVFIAFYFSIRYQKSFKISDFYLALVLYTAAALYRSPYNIFLFATLLQQGLSAFKNKRVNYLEATGYFVAYSIIISFHIYKNYLGVHYGSMFLTELMPPESLSELLQILEKVKQNWLWSYFTWPHYLIIFATTFSLLIFLIRKKTCQKAIVVLSQQVLLVLGGAAAYFLLMARQFPDHDYYIIDSFYPGIALLLLLGLLTVPLEKGWRKWPIGIVAIGLLTWATLNSKEVQKDRYTFNFWDNGELIKQNFEGAAKFLDSMGIPRSAKILVLDAYSTNAPLILLERKGYTVQHTLKKNIEKGLQEDFHYIVVADIFLPSGVILNFPKLTRHLVRLGGNGKISVFEYSKTSIEQGLNKLLAIPPTSKVHSLTFEKDSIANWEHNLSITDTSVFGNHSGLMKSNLLFGPTFIIKKPPYPKNILFKGFFMQTPPQSGFEVVLSITHQNELIYYRRFPVDLERFEPWKEFYCLFSLPHNLPADAEVKCNLYNPKGARVFMDNLSVTLF